MAISKATATKDNYCLAFYNTDASASTIYNRLLPLKTGSVTPIFISPMSAKILLDTNSDSPSAYAGSVLKLSDSTYKFQGTSNNGRYLLVWISVYSNGKWSLDGSPYQYEGVIHTF